MSTVRVGESGPLVAAECAPFVNLETEPIEVELRAIAYLLRRRELAAETRRAIAVALLGPERPLRSILAL